MIVVRSEVKLGQVDGVDGSIVVVKKTKAAYKLTN